MRPTGINWFRLPIPLCLAGGAVLVTMMLAGPWPASSQEPDAYNYVVQSIWTDELGISNPDGLTFSPTRGVFYILEEQPEQSGWEGGAKLVGSDPFGHLAGAAQLAAPIADAVNLAFADSTDSLYFWDRRTGELAQVPIDQSGDIREIEGANGRIGALSASVSDPQGMALDPDRERLYVLDAAGPAIVGLALEPAAGSSDPASGWADGMERMAIRSPSGVRLRGLAYNPADGHLYIMGVEERTLYELGENGQILSTRDLSEVNLMNPQGMVFAPSADPTDDPAIMDLYIADSGDPGAEAAQGRIVELSFREPPGAPAGTLLPVALMQVIDTSKAAWNPSSPDPAGIAFWPDQRTLLISDCEVDEGHPDWQGKNVFEASLGGDLLSSCGIMAYSNEPTGVAVNPDNGHIYFSDDSKTRVFDVDPEDGIFCNGNDTVTSLDVTVFGSYDSEGLAYGENKLFISDGTAAEVFALDLGPDGAIGGGNERVASSFDTYALGLRDPEGIEYNPENGTLFITSTAYDNFFLLETTTAGTVVNQYDLTFLGRMRRSGLALGPCSQDSSTMCIYLASRGVDNGEDPNENDGKVYEFLRLPPPETIFLPLVTGN